jgi:hypothetical protein
MWSDLEDSPKETPTVHRLGPPFFKERQPDQYRSPPWYCAALSSDERDSARTSESSSTGGETLSDVVNSCEGPPGRLANHQLGSRDAPGQCVRELFFSQSESILPGSATSLDRNHTIAASTYYTTVLCTCQVCHGVLISHKSEVELYPTASGLQVPLQPCTE